MRVVVVTLILAALHAPAAADPRHDFAARLGQHVDRLANIFDSIELELVPDDLDRLSLVRWQRAMRDLVFHAAARLAALAADSELRIPDVSVLVTEPVANSESSGFGWRDDPIRHRPRFHGGTDFRGKRGTPVVAAGDGVVVFAGRRGGYGNLVEVDHGGGVITRYAHLRRMHARRDEVVVAGQRIGQIGSTGRTTGPHLHFEVRLGDRPVDPVTALTVAQLHRDAPEMGRIAAFALAPEVQAHVASRVDPPKHRRAKAKESRPDRPGRVKRVKPVS